MSGSIALVIGGSLDLILRPPPPEVVPMVTLRAGLFTVTSWGVHMAYTLPSGMKIEVKVAYVDGHGNPATIDGEVTWSSGDETVAAIEVDATDSTLATITAVGPVGVSQVVATADADLGQGTRSLNTLLDVTTVAGEAVAGTIAPTGEATPAGGQEQAQAPAAPGQAPGQAQGQDEAAGAAAGPAIDTGPATG